MLIGPDTDAQREMVRLYTVDGLSANEISRRMYWSASTVRKMLRRNGVTIRPRGGPLPGARRRYRFTREQELLMCEQYRNGLSTDEIARRTGAGGTTIRAILRRNGVEIRPKRVACRLGRLRVVADEGTLSDAQRRALTLVENRGPLVTTEIARLTHRSVEDASRALRQLARLGLVRSKRAETGRGRPRRWFRTGLQLRDVLEASLAPSEQGEAWLPIQPFRDWLNSLIDAERRAARFMAVTGSQGNGDGSGGLSVMDAVARRLGMDESRLRVLMNKQETVSISVADRALLNADTGTLLSDLWPELGEDREVDEFRHRNGAFRAAAIEEAA